MKLALALMAAACALSASQAGANMLTFTTGDVYSGSFGDSNLGDGNFTDTLDFTVDGDGWFAGSLTSNTFQIGSSTDVDFTSVYLTGPSGTLPFNIINNDGGLGTTDTANLATMLLAGSYELTIEGIARGDGAFGGDTSFTVTGVPEPASWAMMLSGFTMLGVAMRRRNVGATQAV